MTTIGVAISIPEPYGAELRRYRAEFGDPMAASIPTHVTLLPPTELAETALDRVDEHLLAVAARFPPFRIRLRGTATFRPVSPVVFVTLAEGISECEQLAFSVRRGPLSADQMFPYHPHVTVAHHVDEDTLDRAFGDLETFECEFVVDRFHLYVHNDRAGWVPNRDFTLTAAAGG